jgi:hypothetical protein
MQKRVRHDVVPDDEAAWQWLQDYGPIIERWDQFGYEKRYGVFPLDVWSVILGHMTARDILRLSKLSKTFCELAQSAQIWNAIFVREFGEEALKEARRTMPDARARVFAWRLKQFLPTPAAFENVQWIFQHVDGPAAVINFMGKGLYLMYKTNEEKEERVALLLEHGFVEYDLNEFREGRQPNYFKVFRDKIMVLAQDRKDLWDLAMAVVYEMLSREYYPIIIEHRKELLKNEICAYCAQPAEELRCSACKSAFYCNAACQENDWARHKRKCLK